MRYIKLTQGKRAIIDNEDYDRISKHKWHYNKYATRRVCIEGKMRSGSMHQEVLGKPPKGLQIDHINGNKIDNRKCNLRVVTYQQNRLNCGKRKHNKSGYKGVSWSKIGKKWLGQIEVKGENIYLGYFTSKVAAHRAYCKAARKYHGEYCRFS